MTRRREFPQRAWRSVKNQPGARQKSEESRQVLPAKGDDIMVAARLDVVGTGRLWRDLPGRFWAVEFGRHARSAGVRPGTLPRRLAVVPQGAGGKRRPTDGSPITLHQGGSNPSGRPPTQAIGRTKKRINRPSDWANAHWPNRQDRSPNFRLGALRHEPRIRIGGERCFVQDLNSETTK